MNDALDDLAMMRAAGSGPVLEDTEHLYPPRKWDTQPGAMPTVADIINERNHWRTGYEIAIQQLAAVPREAVAAVLEAITHLPALEDGDDYLFPATLLTSINELRAWLDATPEARNA
jgi:hypothetical protein